VNASLDTLAGVVAVTLDRCYSLCCCRCLLPGPSTNVIHRSVHSSKANSLRMFRYLVGLSCVKFAYIYDCPRIDLIVLL